jgi:ATP-dependent DNA helicase PIF1
MPFGGVQLVMVGDLGQLPPVVTADARPIFYGGLYASPHFITARCWEHTGFRVCQLTTSFRQTDGDFRDVLDAVRIGDVTRRN